MRMALWIYFRRYLRETLKMANSEDLNRLTSCSLVLLGHIFLSLGNNAVSNNRKNQCITVHFRKTSIKCLQDISEILDQTMYDI